VTSRGLEERGGGTLNVAKKKDVGGGPSEITQESIEGRKQQQGKGKKRTVPEKYIVKLV